MSRDAVALTAQEATDLRKLEGRVRAGLQTFHAVGRALAEISERKLYRQEYATFGAYCRERWGFGRSHAYRLMGAAAVLSNLADVAGGDIEPPRESTIRALTRLPPAAQADAYAAARADGEPATPTKVQSVVDRLLGADDPGEQQRLAKEEGERIRREGAAVEQGRADDDRTKRFRKILVNARLCRKDARGLGGEGEQVIEHAEAIMRIACSELDLDPHAAGLRGAA